MIKSFFAALSFISRLPVPARLSQGLEIEQYQRSIITFPLVGLLLGAIAGAVVMLLQPWCGGPLAALLGVLALATLLLGVNGLRAALITLVLVWALGQALKRTLGGQTGDTLGAAIELGEVIFLLALL